MKPFADNLRVVSWWLMAAVILAVAVVRFVGLNDAPDGFFIDEADSSMHVICLSQTGHDANGVSYPLMSGGGGGGVFTPTYLYLTIPWIKIFGYSRASFRALAALKMTIALLGLFFLARFLMTPRAAFFVVLAASISPWAFPFSRQAMDDPNLFPLGLIWGMFFFLRSSKIRDAILSALFFSMALYCYPPSRAQIPLFGIALLVYKRRSDKISWPFLSVFLLTGVALCSPLIYQLLSGEMFVRYNIVGIFSPYYKHQIGSDTPWGAVKVFVANFFKHFNPKFLFLTGDTNLRHSTQFSGEFSWLDDFALLGALMVLGAMLERREKGGEKPIPVSPVFMLFLSGFLLGIVPAALTWEGLPHALRSVGAWPFVSLMTGFVLWKMEGLWRYSVIPAALIAMIFSVLYLKNYFTIYPRISEAWFDVTVKNAALEAQRTGNWNDYLKFTEHYGSGPVSRRYYLVLYGGQTCESSRVMSMPQNQESNGPAQPAGAGH